MLDAVKTVLSKYATFSGRAPRGEYWWWVLFVFIVLFITGMIDAVIFAPMTGGGPDAGQPLSFLVSLGLLLPNLAVGVRRLHDIDKSGWWLLIGLIPILGALVLIYFFVQKGTEGGNRFG
ncbi:Integral membrane protein [Rhodovulum sp. P5]|uniref:DUF805 domain-containing protein n=1 Tax=Rhodovulum sp. P5 TaxID=1564506 RepID=UPI0009C34887|nr:DUF805 domain-containing protein [Rhodovulum sp. P5]ARE41894.1 Integral membrane protein [Rhodovulum sp. P5]